MKQPKDMNVFSIADVYYENEKELSLEKQLTIEPLAAVLLNFEREDVEEYEETICVLIGMGSYSYAHKKLDLDLKNQPSPPCGVGVHFEEPLDDDVPTDDDYRLPNSDVEDNSDDDDSNDNSDAGGTNKEDFSTLWTCGQQRKTSHKREGSFWTECDA
ncbi:hypothetical protein CQW23_01864 [Capsicum baccatum]|uniref:Uncharacterized protein n=1 Tax=Capsicum baccatum TaxID=33114 RepID=A0A2G2XQ74_CAPBA|nr:hypothetical protein CQW23_01864 [Capsicum baccatum]